MTPERRSHPRVPVSIDGRWQGPVTASLCKTTNLSLGGCFAQTPSLPVLNEPMFITLFLGGRGSMMLPGHVAHVEPGVGFGMQFGELGSDDRFRLGEELTRISRSRPSPRGGGHDPTRVASMWS